MINRKLVYKISFLNERSQAGDLTGETLNIESVFERGVVLGSIIVHVLHFVEVQPF